MRSRILWALAGLNVLLAALLVSGLTNPKPAVAQRAARPADYLMVPIQTNGGVSGLVCVVDSSNGQLSGMAYDDGQRQLVTLPPIDLNRVFAQAAAAPADEDRPNLRRNTRTPTRGQAPRPRVPAEDDNSDGDE
jgi:hypothetical protein